MKKTLLLSLILIAAAASVFGQGFSDMAGNPKCSDFGFASETKIDPPQAGTYQVAGIGGSVVGTVTITINSSHTASWTASGNIIGAVIMKGGPAGRVYHYDPLSSGADMLTTPPLDNGNFPAISHISFCSRRPTAADVSLSGRVVRSGGRAVPRAAVTVQDAATGQLRTVQTSAFGYFTVDGLKANGYYFVTVAAKGLWFRPRDIAPVDSIADFDFVSER